jgi:hypothetical protein
VPEGRSQRRGGCAPASRREPRQGRDRGCSLEALLIAALLIAALLIATLLIATLLIATPIIGQPQARVRAALAWMFRQVGPV